MKEISLDKLKSIQFEILKNVDVFCKKNNLRYSLSYGTLLGAIRHKGFIPWDDDIDIMMPRDDYEKFIRTYSFMNNKLYSYKNDNGYIYPYIKVADTRTIIDMSEFLRVNQIGVYIDVFPIDGFPESIEDSKKLISGVRFYLKLFCLKYGKIFRKGRGWNKNIIHFVSQIFLFSIPSTKIAEKIDGLAQKCTYDGSKYVGNIVNGDAGIKERILKTNFQSFIDVDFEGTSFKAIIGYDDFLKCIYGDYMKLPPKEEQVAPHDFKAYWL